MAIDITGANTYFGVTAHTKSDIWTKIPLARRIAAIAHATRLIQNRLGDADIETDTTEARDFPRHDAAVYEQALFILETDAMDAALKVQMISEKQIGSLAANLRAVQSLHNVLAPAAIDFLYVTRSVRLSRG